VAAVQLLLLLLLLAASAEFTQWSDCGYRQWHQHQHQQC